MIERPLSEPATDGPPLPERPARHRAAWGALDVGYATLLILAAFVPVFLALLLIYRALGVEENIESDPRAATIGLLSQLALNGIALGLAAVFSLRKYRLKIAAWGLVDPPRFQFGKVILTLLLCYAALFSYTAIALALPFEILKPESNVPQELFDHAAVVPLAVFFILVVAPLTEEMFFRGFLFQGFESSWGFWPGALVSGGIFSLIHGSIGLLPPFLAIGVLLAWVQRRTGSLWNAIAVHFMFNAISLIAIFLIPQVEK